MDDRSRGRTMRRDRPMMPERPGSACGLGSSGYLHLGATARYQFRLTKGGRRSSFPGASRAHGGNVGQDGQRVSWASRDARDWYSESGIFLGQARGRRGREP